MFYFVISFLNVNAMHPYIKTVKKKPLMQQLRSSMQCLCKLFTIYMFIVHLKPEAIYISSILITFAAIFLSMCIHTIANNADRLNVLIPFNLLNIDQI